MEFLNKVKKEVKDTVENMHDFAQKDVIVNVDHKGIKTKARRNTQKRIKWQSKNR